MSKLNMKFVRIISLRQDRKSLMEHLQNSGLIQLASVQKSKESFEKPDTKSSVAAFERNAADAENALRILNDYAPEKKGMLSSLSGRRRISSDEIGVYASNAAAVMRKCNKLITLKKRLAENKADIVRLKANIAQLEPWRSLDIPFCTEGTEKTAVFIGSVPFNADDGVLAEMIAHVDNEILFDFEIVYSSHDMTCFALITPRDQSDKTEAALRQLGFAKPMGANRSLPADKIERLEQSVKDSYTRQQEIEDEIRALADDAQFRRNIEETYDYYHIRADKYSAIGTLEHSRHTFIITGYVPEEDLEKLEELVTRVAACTVEVFDAGSDAPVKLKNNAFSRPAQSIVTMYSSPGHEDIDPTPITAFFFYLFFGMMFSDAGYGLALTIGSAVLIKKFKPEQRMKENLKLFMYCGISTTICGLIYGSIFGDAPAVLYNMITGAEITMEELLPWPTINTQAQALPMLIVSMIFGLVHILVGMGCKFYILCRGRHYADAVCDVGFWMLLLIGVGVACAGLATVSAVTTAGAVIATVSLAGILLTGGRKKKGFGKVIGGIASLYDITSYISDLLSYSRLFALGLTTGIMAQVFNMLSQLFGTSAISFIPMALVFVAGHLITIALNALGSYVHTIRLQYVEMFSKFYDGGGNEFTPFALNSKYITIQEDK